MGENNFADTVCAWLMVLVQAGAYQQVYDPFSLMAGMWRLPRVLQPEPLEDIGRTAHEMGLNYSANAWVNGLNVCRDTLGLRNLDQQAEMAQYCA